MIRQVAVLAVLLWMPIAGQAQPPEPASKTKPIPTFFMAGGRAPDDRAPRGAWTTIELGGGTEWVADYRAGISFGPEFSFVMPVTHFTHIRPVLSMNAYFNLPAGRVDDRWLPRRIHLGIVTTEHPDGTRNSSYKPGLSYGIGTLTGDGRDAGSIEFRGRMFRDGGRLTQSWGIRVSLLSESW